MAEEEIGFIDANGNYFEGENNGFYTEVPKRPSFFHEWNGNKWVLNSQRKTETELAETDSNRQAAYTAEADPLFFQEQRGDVPAGTWLAKVNEIKARYPK